MVMFLAATVCGADFLDSFTEYRNQAKRNLNLNIANTSYLSDSSWNQFIREGAVEIMNAVHGIKRIYTDSLLRGINVHALDTLVTNVVTVWWQKGDSIKALLPVPMSQWYQMEHKTCRAQRGFLARPSYYDNTEGKLFFYPTPMINGDTLKTLVSVDIPDIAASDSLDIIPKQYRTTVCDYATWKAASSRGNFQAGIYERKYLNGIAKIKSLPVVTPAQ